MNSRPILSHVDWYKGPLVRKRREWTREDVYEEEAFEIHGTNPCLAGFLGPPNT